MKKRHSYQNRSVHTRGYDGVNLNSYTNAYTQGNSFSIKGHSLQNKVIKNSGAARALSTPLSSATGNIKEKDQNYTRPELRM